MTNLIEFKKLCVRYDNNDDLTIKDMTLDIKDGEFVVFVGPSGCGKSTTLKVLSGLEDVHSGEIFISGELANYKEPKDRDIAMVFQNYALYPHFSVRKNVEVGLRNSKLSKEEIGKKADIVAEKLKITEVMDKLPKDLSGGQQQRVALARAIIREPKVYIFDEPLSNLDAKLRHSTRNEIISMHRELKKTFFYVTHDQVEAMTMADRIVVLKDGIVQQFDKPTNIFYHPSNLFVAKFIGTPEINSMIAEVVGNEIVISEEFKVQMANETVKRVNGYKKLYFCVRPDDIEYSTVPKDGYIKVEIVGREILGNTTVINCAIDGQTLDFIIRTEHYHEDIECYYIKINTEKSLFFDIESELNIDKAIN